MNSSSPEYRIWKRRQNEKNLLKRTRKKEYRHNRRTAQLKYNCQIKKSAIYNSELRRYEFCSPLNFSMINNPEETSTFFNEIIMFITNKRNFGKNIFIDISKISELTIDALMYLLAIVNNLGDNFRNKYSFSGNTPTDESVSNLFAESGFFHFVKYQGTAPLIKNNNAVQIMSGEDCDTNLAKKLCDFVCEKALVNKRNCSFLYNMIIELMSNTHRHAYPCKEGILHSRWYCFAKYSSTNNTISFSFMDTGTGIPSTVRKNFIEKIDFLQLKNESSYVVSALEGEFRTATLKSNRGKGLPKIREFSSSHKIENLHILANKANVEVYENVYNAKDISTPFCGTLYYWEIDISMLKGESL